MRASSDLGPYAVVPLWWLELVDGATLKLAITVASYCAPKTPDRARPSQSTLAADLGISGRTIRRQLEKLREVGIIDWHLEREGMRQYSRYTVNFAAPCNTTIPAPCNTTIHADTSVRLHADTQDVRGRIENKEGPSLTLGSNKSEEQKTSGPFPSYPESVVSGVARTRVRDEAWDALVELCGEPSNKSERGRRNVAVRDIKESLTHHEGDARSEIMRRAENYARRWPEIDLTPTALATNWTVCDTADPKSTKNLAVAASMAEKRKRLRGGD